MSDNQPPLRNSARFNASDADVIFQSADNVLFSIHRKNLEVATGAFPPSGFSTEGQNVALSESSATLELMFQYIYPMLQPDVPSLTFGELAPLAEAAEKYQVFPAMLICKIYMQKFLPKHVQEIMAYAAVHGYNDIVEEAAPLLLAIPLEEVLPRLPANFVVPWALYHSSWDKVLRLARSFPTDSKLVSLGNTNESHIVWVPGKGGEEYATKCSCNVNQAMLDILIGLKDVQSLRNVAHLFTSSSACEYVAPHLDTWREKIEGEVRAIKPFVTYL